MNRDEENAALRQALASAQDGFRKYLEGMTTETLVEIFSRIGEAAWPNLNAGTNIEVAEQRCFKSATTVCVVYPVFAALALSHAAMAEVVRRLEAETSE